ncbi:hypothetical protein EDD16DRAFT_1706251 [Pisolithus croceorrhizus]|nr:hypothetical protein EDD16DRAFT_1706251 [Pisolithus croceorrhizus]
MFVKISLRYSLSRKTTRLTAETASQDTEILKPPPARAFRRTGYPESVLWNGETVTTPALSYREDHGYQESKKEVMVDAARLGLYRWGSTDHLGSPDDKRNPSVKPAKPTLPPDTTANLFTGSRSISVPPIECTVNLSPTGNARALQSPLGRSKHLLER